jgi:cell wall-associated NlpC family hydrolase
MYQPRHAIERSYRGARSTAVGLAAAAVVGLTLSSTPAASAATLDRHELHLQHLRDIGQLITTTARVTVSGIAGYAASFAGAPHYYQYGGEGPYGFDCSGLAQVVYAHFGMHIPRISNDQAHYLKWESESAAQPGDLVFYGYGGYSYHTAIYLGGGKVVSALDPAEGIVVTPVNYPGPSFWFGTLR